MTDPLAHVVIVREDLPIGVAAAQIVHAAGESVEGPVPPDAFAIVLGVPGETELRALSSRLTAADVEHRLIVETDGAHAGQAMTLGCRPAPRSSLRRHFSSLPLFARVAQSRAPGAIPEVGGSRPSTCTNSLASANGSRPLGGNPGLNPGAGTNSVPIAQLAEHSGVMNREVGGS